MPFALSFPPISPAMAASLRARFDTRPAYSEVSARVVLILVYDILVGVASRSEVFSAA